MNRTSWYRVSPVVALGAAVLLAACGQEAKAPEVQAPAPQAAAAPAAKPTGKVVTIEAYSDGAGNFFKPAEVEVERGDIVRFVLKSGVHNVNFLPDSNPGAKNLPPASEMLQLPEQTFEVLVSMDPGSYYYQCDPHALLGMVGRIKVKN
jgi:plastocyanin